MTHLEKMMKMKNDTVNRLLQGDGGNDGNGRGAGTEKTPAYQAAGRRLLTKSRLFRRSFLFYLIMLLAFLAGYLMLIIFDYNSSQKKELEARFSSESRLVGALIDGKLSRAGHITSSIGSSTTLTSLYVKTYQSNSAVDAYTYAQAKTQILSIQSSMNDMSIANVLLIFNGTQRIYTSSMVISLEHPYEGVVRGPGLKRASVGELLDISSRNILLQNEYLIWHDDYCYTYQGVSRGIVMVLINLQRLENEILAALPKGCGFGLYFGDELLCELSADAARTRPFDYVSSVNEDVLCRLYVPESAFAIDFSSMFGRALIIGIIAVILAVILSWKVSMRQYRPFESIARMVRPDEQDVVVTDTDAVIGAMEKLITEKDAASRRMMEIRPYARKGAIQDVLIGSLSLDNLRVLYAENPGELKFLYYAVAVVNLVILPAKDGAAPSEVLIGKAQKAIDDMSCECCAWYSSAVDHHHIYCIAAFDDIPEWEELFTRLQRRIEEAAEVAECRVTVGVSLLKDDVAQLTEAREEAQKALAFMITGGRGAVYFYEKSDTATDRNYWFPKDAAMAIAGLMQDRDNAGLEAYFGELLNRNTKERDLSLRATRLLADELHLAVVHAMQELTLEGGSELAIDVRKVEGEATIEEIFSYYRSVCETVSAKLPPKTEDRSEEEKRQEIIAYIEAHYLDPDLSLQVLTERFRVTNRYISTLCNTAFGKNYLQYVQEKRIYYARNLLDAGGMTIEEVAQKSGYSSVLTFRRNFRSILGMNPSDYRG